MRVDLEVRAPAVGDGDRRRQRARARGGEGQLVVATLLALVLPLGLDTFAVAAALGAAGVSRQQHRRVSVLFVAFEAGMPLVGLALGAPLGRSVGVAGDYIAIAVLLGFGLYTLFAADDVELERLQALGRLEGWGAVLIGVSISLDELAIGFTLGLLRLPVLLVIALIALQALVVTQLGLRLGARVNERMREGAERVAGIALTALALVLLAERLVR